MNSCYNDVLFPCSAIVFQDVCLFRMETPVCLWIPNKLAALRPQFADRFKKSYDFIVYLAFSFINVGAMLFPTFYILGISETPS